MSRRVDGRSALRRFDGVISDTRTELGEAIEAAEEVSRDIAEVRRRQAAAYRELAAIQIDEADTPQEIANLERLDADVSALIAEHDSYLETLLADLDAAAETLSTLEEDRRTAAADLDSAIAAYETKVDEVEAALEEDPTYLALVSAVSEAEAVSEKAHAKLELARSDMQEKGEVFRTDPLFMYLWKRRYRTTDYKAGNFFRVLDGWVAGLCSYEKSYRNYERLVELPEWLEGHVAAMDTHRDEAASALAEAEAAALTEAGGDALAETVDAARARLTALDADIAAAETAHLDIAGRQSAAERGEAGPAYEARQRLANALKQRAIPDLRVLAAQTVTPADDGIVDALVGLRKDEMSMELRMDQDKGLPVRRRADLARLEAFRRAFKAAQLDSGYASFKASSVDDVLARLVSGRLEAHDAVRHLRRGMRRSSPRTDPRFGGPRRARTVGLPDVAVGIGMEILKEMGRSGSRRGGFDLGGMGGGGFPGSLPRGRRTKRSMPRSPSRGRRGKFKTGGGF
ncbi:MAG: hypothetical protein AAFX86_03070 [Pseudomonadota bacterium]